MSNTHVDESREPDITTADGAVRIYTEAGSFLWDCPTCGRGYAGKLADEPVSGWDAPRWMLADGPTLTPSLGCRGMLDGSCTGHWWLRDGRLLSA